MIEPRMEEKSLSNDIGVVPSFKGVGTIMTDLNLVPVVTKSVSEDPIIATKPDIRKRFFLQLEDGNK